MTSFNLVARLCQHNKLIVGLTTRPLHYQSSNRNFTHPFRLLCLGQGLFHKMGMHLGICSFNANRVGCGLPLVGCWPLKPTFYNAIKGMMIGGRKKKKYQNHVAARENQQPRRVADCHAKYVSSDTLLFLLMSVHCQCHLHHSRGKEIECQTGTKNWNRM